MAGVHTKYFLSIVFEVVTMALAIIVCNAMLSSGLPISTTDTSTWSAVLLYLCELTFGIALTVGSIKGRKV